MSPIELGKFIANLRNEKNLTQEELAEKLFIDKRKISRWECGTSIPEFEMLIMLSEILDVSLYELSICKRIEDEHITKKMINKFKSIKDFKKYKTMKKINIGLLIIFFILFIITASYTIKYHNTVEVYKLESLDENYHIDGGFITTNNYSLFYLKDINYTDDDNNNKHITLDNCEYMVNDNGIKKINLSNDNKHNYLSSTFPFYEVEYRKKLNSLININIKCTRNDKNTDYYSFDVTLQKIYNNKLF